MTRAALQTLLAALGLDQPNHHRESDRSMTRAAVQAILVALGRGGLDRPNTARVIEA